MCVVFSFAAVLCTAVAAAVAVAVVAELVPTVATAAVDETTRAVVSLPRHGASPSLVRP